MHIRHAAPACAEGCSSCDGAMLETMAAMFEAMAVQRRQLRAIAEAASPRRAKLPASAETPPEQTPADRPPLTAPPLGIDADCPNWGRLLPAVGHRGTWGGYGFDTRRLHSDGTGKRFPVALGVSVFVAPPSRLARFAECRDCGPRPMYTTERTAFTRPLLPTLASSSSNLATSLAVIVVIG